jgi:hypothetical protein
MARQERVASDLVFCQGASGGLHHTEDTCFGGRIMYLLFSSEKCANRSNTNNGPASSL